MMTKKEMDRRGIVYEAMDLTEHPEQLEAFKEQGLLQAPIVTTDVKVWSGFRLDKIKSLHSFLLGENHK
jgi:glutaredoxin-like protein NrdH